MDELARQPRHGPNYTLLLHLLNDMQNHASSWPFLHPVSREDVADYYEVIKEPMDLSTMEAKLEREEYTTPEEFIKYVFPILSLFYSAFGKKVVEWC